MLFTCRSWLVLTTQLSLVITTHQYLGPFDLQNQKLRYPILTSYSITVTTTIVTATSTTSITITTMNIHTAGFPWSPLSMWSVTNGAKGSNSYCPVLPCLLAWVMFGGSHLQHWKMGGGQCSTYICEALPNLCNTCCA